MTTLSSSEVHFNPTSTVDKYGRLFEWKGKIYRAVYDKRAYKRYGRLVKSSDFSKLIENGLINTWVADDIKLREAEGVLQHKKIEFISTYAEWTAHQIWLAAKMCLKLNRALAEHQLTLLDCHPWNILFDYSEPKFVDFGSIGTMKEDRSWIMGLHRFFILPLWIYKNTGNFGVNVFSEFKKEHVQGVGTTIVTSKKMRFIPFDFYRTLKNYNKIIDSKDLFQQRKIFNKIDDYLDQLKPEIKQKYWSSYPGVYDTLEGKLNNKQKILVSKLKKGKRGTLLDMGANKGWYAFAAEELGYKVIAFDYEEFNVDFMHKQALTEKKKVLALHMNFLFPTTKSGVALVQKDAFERLACNTTFVLALVHHLAITQKVTFRQIARVIGGYTKQESFVEFVPKSDKCVKGWDIPVDYSVDNFINAMGSEHLSHSNTFKLDSGRLILHFKKV